MPAHSQKITPNTALKMAIVATGQKQGALAMKVRMSEQRLSQLVTGRAVATETEMAKLSRVLHRAPSELFPGAELTL